MMEKQFNSSIKQPTGTTLNTLVFGGLVDAKNRFLIIEPELIKSKHTRSCGQMYAPTEHTGAVAEGTANTRL